MTKVSALRFRAAALIICIFSAGFVWAGDRAPVKQGRLYVAGMGPAGSDLAAPRALEIIKNADILLCSPGLPDRFKLFGGFIDPSKIAFDPWEGILGKGSSELRKKDPGAWEKQAAARRLKVQKFVRAQIDAGKTVVMMDGGDAAIYGPSLNYLLRGFDDSLFEVIPGMGAVNAAAAALKRSLTSEGVRFVMLTSFSDLFGEGDLPDESLVADISKYKSNLVLYMSLGSMEQLAEIFQKYYPADLPAAVVYYAGFEDKEYVLRSTIKNIARDIRRVDTSWMGLVVIGEAAR